MTHGTKFGQFIRDLNKQNLKQIGKERKNDPEFKKKNQKKSAEQREKKKVFWMEFRTMCVKTAEKLNI